MLLQIQQPARGSHQNIHTLFEFGDLRVHADTAKNHGAVEFEVLAVSTNGLFYLGCEFTGGGQNESANANATEFVFCFFSAAEAMQKGQGKGCGFARTGLGAAQQVVACKNQGNGLGLNGGWGFIALFKHGFENGGSQKEFFEFHIGAPHDWVHTYQPFRVR